MFLKNKKKMEKRRSIIERSPLPAYRNQSDEGKGETRISKRNSRLQERKEEFETMKAVAMKENHGERKYQQV